MSQWNTATGWPYREMQFRVKLVSGDTISAPYLSAWAPPSESATHRTLSNFQGKRSDHERNLSFSWVTASIAVN